MADRELVAGWTEELVSSPWSKRVRVVTGAIPIHIRGEQLTVLDDIPAALDRAEALRGDLGVLILGGVPDPHDRARLHTLTTRPGSGWVVIVLGETDQDDWRFTAHSDGRLDTGPLGITVSANRPDHELAGHRLRNGVAGPG